MKDRDYGDEDNGPIQIWVENRGVQKYPGDWAFAHYMDFVVKDDIRHLVMRGHWVNDPPTRDELNAIQRHMNNEDLPTILDVRGAIFDSGIEDKLLDMLYDRMVVDARCDQLSCHISLFYALANEHVPINGVDMTGDELLAYIWKEHRP